MEDVTQQGLLKMQRRGVSKMIYYEKKQKKGLINRIRTAIRKRRISQHGHTMNRFKKDAVNDIQIERQVSFNKEG